MWIRGHGHGRRVAGLLDVFPVPDPAGGSNGVSNARYDESVAFCTGEQSLPNRRWCAGLILVIVAALPLWCAWAPATVSTACDDLLDQLNDLSFLGAAASLWKEPPRFLSVRRQLRCREFGAPEPGDAPAAQPDEPDARPGARVPGGRHGDRQAHARDDGRWASLSLGRPSRGYLPDSGVF